MKQKRGKWERVWHTSGLKPGGGFYKARPLKREYRIGIVLNGKKQLVKFKVSANNVILPKTIRIKTTAGLIRPQKEKIGELLNALKMAGF